ncbi:MAG TPA: NAD-dependent epimerase/dehydratase family protein [Acidimicrobiales bacterium]|nr:NAD-dependent epimerase/dehydratase family protein [Acidimicrobiales bacterium]
MGTVLVTGAAGNLGRRVTEQLAARGRVVAVDLVRAPKISPNVEVHSLDLATARAEERLADLASEATALVHLAWQPGGKHNLTVTRHVLSAAATANVRQLVYLSSATVYGAWPDNPLPLTEQAEPRPNPEFAYAVEKRASEVLVERWAKEHLSTRTAVLRPACTLGPDGEQTLYQALAEARRPPLGSEGRMVQFLHIDDLAGAVVHTLAEDLSGTYNVAPDAGLTEEAAGALAGGSASLPLPAALRAALAALHWRSARQAAPPGADAYAEHSWVISGDKLRLSGWRAEYSSEQALVVTDERGRWDDLPQGRRVALTLAAAGFAVAATGAGGAAWWRHRH